MDIQSQIDRLYPPSDDITQLFKDCRETADTMQLMLAVLTEITLRCADEGIETIDIYERNGLSI